MQVRNILKKEIGELQKRLGVKFVTTRNLNSVEDCRNALEFIAVNCDKDKEGMTRLIKENKDLENYCECLKTDITELECLLYDALEVIGEYEREKDKKANKKRWWKF